MVRHYLKIDAAEDLDKLMEQYVEAMWIEERKIDATAAAIAKALSGK